MSINLKTSIKVDSIEKLKQYIEYVKKFVTIKSDKNFQKYIQTKFLETVSKIASDRLPGGKISQLYISNNKIEPLSDGFILYNDTFVETNSSGYNGKFCIALAFEYGTGIVGQENPKVGAWQYNVNGHIDGWWYPTDEDDPNPTKKALDSGDIVAWTRGLQGYEIYRFTAEEIRQNIRTWVKEYNPKKYGGVSL